MQIFLVRFGDKLFEFIPCRPPSRRHPVYEFSLAEQETTKRTGKVRDIILGVLREMWSRMTRERAPSTGFKDNILKISVILSAILKITDKELQMYGFKLHRYKAHAE